MGRNTEIKDASGNHVVVASHCRHHHHHHHHRHLASVLLHLTADTHPDRPCDACTSRSKFRGDLKQHTKANHLDIFPLLTAECRYLKPGQIMLNVAATSLRPILYVDWHTLSGAINFIILLIYHNVHCHKSPKHLSIHQSIHLCTWLRPQRFT